MSVHALFQFLDSFSENIKDDDTSTVENIKAQYFKFNFNANNAFKCDSSDDENTPKAPDISNEMVDETKRDIQENILFDHKDTLFFDSNDVRFNGTYNKKTVESEHYLSRHYKDIYF